MLLGVFGSGDDVGIAIGVGGNGGTEPSLEMSALTKVGNLLLEALAQASMHKALVEVVVMAVQISQAWLMELIR